MWQECEKSSCLQITYRLMVHHTVKPSSTQLRVFIFVRQDLSLPRASSDHSRCMTSAINKGEDCTPIITRYSIGKGTNDQVVVLDGNGVAELLVDGRIRRYQLLRL